jgi:SAM-dependent methyltransferase
MSEHTPGHPPVHPRRALSFAGVAEAYDRARPTYPVEAAGWLATGTTGRVLELGAGTGKLTAPLLGLGREVIATDPSAPMLRLLTRNAPAAAVCLAAAEQIPLASRSVDLVVSGQAFHWFDLDRALPEIARVLRPGGQLALVWNVRDERIPWVKRLGALIGTPEQLSDPTDALVGSKLFGFVDTTTFRFWQFHNQQSLRDLVRSRSNIAVMSELERERVLRRVDDLYAEYGRGADGMRLPYVTRCFRTVVRPQTSTPLPDGSSSAPGQPEDGPDTDALLIDFN